MIIDVFFGILKNRKLTPNFWCSKEYFEYSDAVVELKNDVITVVENGFLIYPPIHVKRGFAKVGKIPLQADFNHFDRTVGVKYLIKEFLDFEFIYNPKDFKNLYGRKWKTLRRNILKWTARNKGELFYRYIDKDDIVKVHNLLINWLKREKRKTHDFDIICNYLNNYEAIKGIFLNGQLKSINIWDVNHKYINFRYNISDMEPFLNEYARYLFYTDVDIVSQNKLVNDSGNFGIVNAHQFKNKFNPIEVNSIYSWRLK